MNSPAKHQQVTTGASFGAFACPEHAGFAVQKAIEKSPDRVVGGVLLFLTLGYALNPQSAIKEAVRASSSLNITGACSLGILSDQGSNAGMEGAVAMVFSQGTALRPNSNLASSTPSEKLCLTLSSPNASTMAIESTDELQFGAITSDEFGEGPYSLWQGGKIIEREYSHSAIYEYTHHYIGRCESARPMSPLMQINRSDQHTLIEVGGTPALQSLNEARSLIAKQGNRVLASQIMAVVSETSDPNSITAGHHQLCHILSEDQQSGHLVLSEPARAGHRLFWVIRDPQYAVQQMKTHLAEAKRTIAGKPKYAMMFRNVNRGSNFHQKRDTELSLFQDAFPNTPMIGLLSHSEIVPGYRCNAAMHHSSTVLTFLY